MRKKLLVALISGVILFLVATIGGGGWFGYTRWIRPVQAYEHALLEMREFRSAQMTMLYGFNMEVAVMDMEPVSLPVDITGSGSIDVEKHKLFMELETQLFGEKMSIREVVDGADVYIKIDDGDYEKISQAELAAYGGMSMDEIRENQLWDDISGDFPYNYIGEETLDGREVYRYEVELSDEQIKTVLDKFTEEFAQSFNAGSGGLFNIQKDDISFKDLTYTLWVEKETQMPVKEHMGIEEIAIELEGYGNAYMKDIQIEISYSDVNEPVTIEVPQI